MLVTIGRTERNFDESQLSEYEQKGYAAVKTAAEPTEKAEKKPAKKAVK